MEPLAPQPVDVTAESEFEPTSERREELKRDLGEELKRECPTECREWREARKACPWARENTRVELLA
jgi:hypothetical protein